MSASLKIDVEFPEKLLFLFDSHPYKILYGGRDGIKSWSAAQALLILGTQRPLRILCARETQQSIRESVHQLLSEQITRLGLSEYYEVLQSTIRQRNVPADGRGTEFIFVGLQNLSITQIKSFESIDICWVEEAQVVSKRSWSILLPTIRKPGSEIWITFNPDLASDDTYTRWVVNPPPGAVVVRTNWRDNNWISAESKAKIEFLRATDPDDYEHIYEGATRSTVAGAIYKAELLRAEREERITRVPYEPRAVVDTSWDLGFGDMVAIWFWQSYGMTHRLIDYYEGTHQAIDHYMQVMQARGYTYGTCILPWDGGTPSLQTGRSIRQMLLAKGFRARVLPQLKVHERINAARTILGQCWFDADKCADGLAGLRRYQWGLPSKDGVEKREPLHDLASHPADAFGYGALHVRVPEGEEQKPDERPYVEPPRIRGEYAPFA